MSSFTSILSRGNNLINRIFTTTTVAPPTTFDQNPINSHLNLYLEAREYGWSEDCGDISLYFNQLKNSFEELSGFLPEESVCYFEKHPFQFFATVDWQQSLQLIKNRGLVVLIEDLESLFCKGVGSSGLVDYLAIDLFIILIQIFKTTPQNLKTKTKKFLGSLLRAAAELDHKNNGSSFTKMLFQWRANPQAASITYSESSLEFIIKKENLTLLKIYFNDGYKVEEIAQIALKLNKPNIINIVKDWVSEKIKSETRDLIVEPYPVAQNNLDHSIVYESDKNYFKRTGDLLRF